ncbi:choice-of-anchor B family protein [Shewanella sp. KX20019]|uniref:choice-of-anchor B family protein n=1 Tax=Shewanella sp. KX20019 TaxID=2803864 RepID=UPI0019261AC3|nr:choice-of-anchor B family protein [Shewanella sp. KX20019]QQX80311.1 choice-of-anchor B family protein [Shewanella sp. KX20019]
MDNLFKHQGIVAALLVIVNSLACQSAMAHSEHDKTRFVSAQGKDIGRCDKVLRSCKTIAYAVKQANKGDRVLVADGEYKITDLEEIFLLNSDIVPVMGGYNRFDHYQSQAPQLNKTILTGVPIEFANALEQRGFRVINDGIAQYGSQLDDMLEAHSSLQQSQSDQPCLDGMSGSFKCNNIDLVSHMPLNSFSSSPSSATDIWGHIDLNTGIEYALIALRNGTAIVDLSKPDAPEEVAFIAGSIIGWRDIKVYQWFDSSSLKWQANAYIVSEGADRVQIVDLSQLPASVSVVVDNAAYSVHNVFISNLDYTTNTVLDGATPALHIVGQNNNGGAFQTYSLADPKNLAPLYLHTGAVREDYTHDVSSVVIDDSRAQNSCQNSLCNVLADFNEHSMRLWDISTQSQPSLLADVSYANPQYVHSGWWSEDKRYVFLHDELDERYLGVNTTLRVFNVDSLESPSLVNEWIGPSKAIDHNGYVRGSRYYMSNYQRGITVLDISNPTDPKEAGFFDTYPASDGASFNGVWGIYPYLPSGLILASDISGGLYVLKDNTHSATFGSSAFEHSESTLFPGDSITVKVMRPTGAGAVSVGYETLGASAQTATDFEAKSGRLAWANNDNTPKTIVINTIDNGQNKELQLFLRLFDPQGGLTLASPSYHTLRMGDFPAQSGVISFASSEQTATESDASIKVSVQRNGGSAGELKVEFSLTDDTATIGTDVEDTHGQLVWLEGDTQAKTITISPINDDIVEGTELFTVELQSVNGSELGTATLAVKLLDDDRSNTAPVVVVSEDREANAGETVTLVATATDADNDPISFLWSQTSGTEVVLSTIDTNQLTFVAPNQDATLEFKVTATDSFDGMTEASVTISVKTVAVIPEPKTATSGGGSLGYFSLFLLLMFGFRKYKHLR